MTFCNLTIYNDNPYWSDFAPNSTFYRIWRGLHKTFATAVTCREGTRTPAGTWSHLGQIRFKNLSLFFRTMHFEYPSVLFDFASIFFYLKEHKLFIRLTTKVYWEKTLFSAHLCLCLYKIIQISLLSILIWK